MENKDKLKCKVIILVCSTTSPIIKSSINLYFISEREIKARDYVMLPDRKGVKFMNYSDIPTPIWNFFIIDCQFHLYSPQYLYFQCTNLQTIFI